MYYIYHIPNIKIGVSTNAKDRTARQGYSDYEIIETHDCIYTASNRECELQQKYGYPTDAQPYWKLKKLHKQYKKDGTFSKWYNSGGKKAKEVCSKSILQYAKDGKFIKEFASQKEAEKELGIKQHNISAVCNGKRKTTGGFIWKFK